MINLVMKFSKISVLLVIIFLVLTTFVVISPVNEFDLLVSRYLQSIDSLLFGRAMSLVSRVGDSPFIALLIGSASLFLVSVRKIREAFMTMALSVSGFIVGSILKILVNRHRPSAELVTQHQELLDKSFPSLHVLVITVFFGYVFYLARSKVKHSLLKTLLMSVSIFMIVTISLSRVYLGVHWASDTIGGYLVGLFFINLAISHAKR